MARVTVEDCVDKVPNRFDLVMLAAHRAREISSGAKITVPRDNDKNPVVALREIAEETLTAEHPREAAVQTNQTRPPVAAIDLQVRDFLGEKGVTAAELQRTIHGNVRELPGQFERTPSILAPMPGDGLPGRPSNYAEHLPDRHQALTREDVNSAMANAIDPDKFTWVIVGDLDKIKTQLEALDLPIEYRGYEASDTAVNSESSSNDSAGSSE